MPTALEALLDEARVALVAGDLSLLAEITPRMELLAETLTAPDRATAERLQRKASRNALLLQSAARGVRSAMGRLSEITTPPMLVTYDALGRRGAVAGPASPVLRRF